MLRKLRNKIREIQAELYISQALARASVTAGLRSIDETRPETWEFSGFSQNGEDGITDFLMNKILEPNRQFIEIGSSTGIDNNTAWLAIARKFSGLMIEGNREASRLAEILLNRINLGVECQNIFVNKDNIRELKSLSESLTPDYLSLDIDGNDYYLMSEILNGGFRPAVITVEYNSVYGPEKSLTIRYDPDFVFDMNGDQYLYYGVSISAWKSFLAGFGYRFVCVDSRGVNGFFLMPDRFEKNFVSAIRGYEYRENFYQKRKYKSDWQQQFALIAHREFLEI